MDPTEHDIKQKQISNQIDVVKMLDHGDSVPVLHFLSCDV